MMSFNRHARGKGIFTQMPGSRLSFLKLPRAVLVLGMVSFLNDTASEMIAPLLPVFLIAQLGAGPAAIGLIEGLADATASIVKLISGRLADRGVPRKSLVLGGYAISNVARPLIGLATNWFSVLLLRFSDRVGKGVRTAPRDAVVAASVTVESRGRAFGFHRAMDNAGAMLGPVLAYLLLARAVPMPHVFLASAVPGVLVVLLLALGLPSKDAQNGAVKSAPPPLRWSVLDVRLRSLIVAAGGLALASVPEVFLILWARAGGLTLAHVPLIWAAYHAAKTVVSAPAGALSDRIGRLPVVGFGWALRVLLLVAFPFIPMGAVGLTWTLFLAYGGALAFTEGAERALVGDLAPARQQGTAFGLYHMLNGILLLPGALLFGSLWEWAGMHSAFFTSAAMTALAAGALMVLARDHGDRARA